MSMKQQNEINELREQLRDLSKKVEAMGGSGAEMQSLRDDIKELREKFDSIESFDVPAKKPAAKKKAAA